VHGHLFAVYKCDSCCAAAVWCCDGHHFCDRCHDDPCSDKHYPCPGPGLCPLGIPHARNTAGNMNRAKEGPSFVIGCTACLGHVDENGEQEDLGGPEGYDFGYPARDWAAFASGEEVVAALGDEEIRARMRAHRPPLRHEGDLAECAERLLLREQGVRSAEALLEAAVGDGRAQLRRAAAGVRAASPFPAARRALGVPAAVGCAGGAAAASRGSKAAAAPPPRRGETSSGPRGFNGSAGASAAGAARPSSRGSCSCRGGRRIDPRAPVAAVLLLMGNLKGLPSAKSSRIQRCSPWRAAPAAALPCWRQNLQY